MPTAAASCSPCSCAACGSASASLKACTACRSVKYCNVACQRAHRRAHRAECNRIQQQRLTAAAATGAAAASNAPAQSHGKDRHPPASNGAPGNGVPEVFDIGNGIRGMKVSSAPAPFSVGASPRASAPSPGVRADVRHFNWVMDDGGNWVMDDGGKREDRNAAATGRSSGVSESSTEADEKKDGRGKGNANDKEAGEDDDDLFAPPPERDDCPVCMVTLPLLNEEAVYRECCGKIICRACIFESKKALEETNVLRILKKQKPLEPCCPFCREEFFETDEEYLDRLKQRVEKNDAKAMYNLAGRLRTGFVGLQPNMRKSFELLVRASELGLPDACYDLSVCYRQGAGVAPDSKKERYYLELAAKRGEVMARHNLGCEEEARGNLGLAFRHWKMSASAGSKGSLKAVEGGFRGGFVSKEDYATCLRAYQKSIDDQWSEEREKYKRTDIPHSSLQ